MRTMGKHWKTPLAFVLTLVVVVAGSIGLVRFRNRERGVTQAVLWAVEDLRAVPDSVIAGVYAVDAYRDATGGLADALRALPVDSIRAFYHAYSLWARDGVLTAGELRVAGPYLGLTPQSPAAPADTTTERELPEGDAIP
ncbi:MAG TPA: hypothetical protein VM118_05950 [Acidobacteriota bacterium]|nr:hypothetical protein [Acidobacteriota bacterium]